MVAIPWPSRTERTSNFWNPYGVKAASAPAVDHEISQESSAAVATPIMNLTFKTSVKIPGKIR
jgi:hypothetical protein